MLHDNLYEFFTAKCKEKNIRIEKLPQLCGISRSSLYRYMKGISPIQQKTEQTFCDVLHLSEEDRFTFHELIELSLYDQTLIQARNALDQVIFGKSRPEFDPMEFVFYSRDKYYRSLSEIFADVLSYSDREEFACRVKIVNCIDENVLHTLSEFIRQLPDISHLTNIEHLVSLVKDDYYSLANVFLNIISYLPLMDYKNYNAYYNTVESLHGQKGLFENTMLIEVNYRENGGNRQQYYWFSLLEDRISNCVKFDDENLHAFIRNSYSQLKQEYPELLCNSRGVNATGMEILEYLASEAVYLIKPNNCFDKIPIAQYKTLLSRIPAEFFESIGPIGSDPGTDMASQYIQYLQARIDISYTRPTIDVYSVGGLEEFAATGKISDHLEGMPPFNKEELKAIFENMRDRNLDEKDPYRLLLTEQDILKNGMIIMVYKGKGVFVSFNQTDYHNGIYNDILIVNDDLETIMIDYIENHIARNYALEAAAATKIINGLIEKYCG